MLSENQVLFGEIQDYIKEKFKRYGQKTTFVEAYQILSGVHCTSDVSVPETLPDFMQWDFSDDTTFVHLCRRIPVCASLMAVAKIRPEINARYPYLPACRSVFVSLEMYGARMRDHVDDCYTLLYALSGKARIVLEEKEFHMNTGELCMISPQIARNHDIDEDTILLSIMIDRTIFENAFTRLLRADYPLSEFFRHTLFQSEKDYLFFMLPPTREIRQIYQHLFQEFVHYDTLSENVSIHYLNILFAKIIRSPESTYSYYAKRSSSPAAFSVPYILKYMEEHFTDLTLEDLADHLNYERSYLSKLIHKYTGKTYTELMTGYRMEKAMDFLRSTDMKINEIARYTGYNSTDHFTRSFRKYTGCSPREFRRNL